MVRGLAGLIVVGLAAGCPSDPAPAPAASPPPPPAPRDVGGAAPPVAAIDPLEGAYEKALAAVATAVEGELAKVDPASIRTYEEGMALVRTLTPNAHMGRVGQSLREQGVDPKALAGWMEANPERVEALTGVMESRLAAQQTKLRAVLERVAELAPPDRRAAIRQQLAAAAVGDDAGSDEGPPPWIPITDPAELAAIGRSAGAARGVVVDFSAAWCMPCRELERGALADDEVVQRLAAFDLARVDVTDPSPPLVTLQARLGVTALPHLLVFASGDALLAALDGKREPDGRVTSVVSARDLLQVLQTDPGAG